MSERNNAMQTDLIARALARVEECEKRAERATAGPWSVRPTPHQSQSLLVRGDPFLASTQLPTEDADFAAAARTDVPALCRLVRALLDFISRDDLPVAQAVVVQDALREFGEGK